MRISRSANLDSSDIGGYPKTFQETWPVPQHDRPDPGTRGVGLRQPSSPSLIGGLALTRWCLNEPTSSVAHFRGECNRLLDDLGGYWTIVGSDQPPRGSTTMNRAGSGGSKNSILFTSSVDLYLQVGCITSRVPIDVNGHIEQDSGRHPRLNALRNSGLAAGRDSKLA